MSKITLCHQEFPQAKGYILPCIPCLIIIQSTVHSAVHSSQWSAQFGALHIALYSVVHNLGQSAVQSVRVVGL